MNSINNGVASEYELPREPRLVESNGSLPQTNCRIPMSKTNGVGERICENCNKEDVCKYKEECMKAVKDILDIEERTNIFIKTSINCKKWSGKPAVGIR